MDDGLLLLLRFAFVWIGIYLGLTFYPNPEGVTAVRTVEFPIGFLGNPFVAIFTMTAWLDRTVEPAILNRLGRPPALRRPDWRPPLLDRVKRADGTPRAAAGAGSRQARGEAVAQIQ
jgi:hypothetical protein